MDELLIYCCIAIPICMVAKFFFWINIKKKSFKLLYRSFIRYYSVYDMHDAPCPNTLLFWKASNFINLVLWAAIVGLILIGLFSLSAY
jgi:hypothetical protein